MVDARGPPPIRLIVRGARTPTFSPQAEPRTIVFVEVPALNARISGELPIDRNPGRQRAPRLIDALQCPLGYLPDTRQEGSKEQGGTIEDHPQSRFTTEGTRPRAASRSTRPRARGTPANPPRKRRGATAGAPPSPRKAPRRALPRGRRGRCKPWAHLWGGSWPGRLGSRWGGWDRGEAKFGGLPWACTGMAGKCHELLGHPHHIIHGPSRFVTCFARFAIAGVNRATAELYTGMGLPPLFSGA